MLCSMGFSREQERWEPIYHFTTNFPRAQFVHSEALWKSSEAVPFTSQTWVCLCGGEERARGHNGMVCSRTKALPRLTHSFVIYLPLTSCFFMTGLLSILEIHQALFSLWTLHLLVMFFPEKVTSSSMSGPNSDVTSCEKSSSPILAKNHSWPSAHVSLFHTLDGTYWQSVCVRCLPPSLRMSGVLSCSLSYLQHLKQHLAHGRNSASTGWPVARDPIHQ